MKLASAKNMDKIIHYYIKVRYSLIFVSICTFLILYVILCFLPGKSILYVDEHVHYAQIVSLTKGTFKMSEQPSMLPGYHALMAGIAFIFGNVNIVFFRLISIALASIAIGLYSKLYALVNGKDNIGNASVFASFPIIVPYFFLIYTDVLSLLLFIAALYAGLNKKYQLSIVLGILNLAVRQNTFFWYIFTFLLIFLSDYPVSTLKSFKGYLKKCWLFLVGILIFIAFIFVNKGIAIGAKDMHPGTNMNFGNIFFLLFLTGVFIFPFRIKMIKRPSASQYLVLIFLLILYVFCFNVTHPYNLFDTNYFLRNDVLRYATSNVFTRAIFFIPMAAGVFVYFNFYEENRKVFLLYLVFGTLSLLPSWLIEQRYYFIHFMLLFLYGLKSTSSNYYKIVIGYSVISMLLLGCMFNNIFFI